MKLLHLKVVLVAIGDDEDAVRTLQGASELAASAGARLHVVHVTPSAARANSDVQQLIERAGLSSTAVRLHLIPGEPPHVIRALADEIGADVIVLGRHRGLPANEHALGSTALAVVTNSWAPCLILGGEMRLPLERVLVPVDLSDTSRGALVVGLSWASALRTTKKLAHSERGAAVTLRALFVESSASADASPRERALDDELNRLRQDAGNWANVAIDRAVIANSDVPRAIAEYATDQQASLIVLGTRGLGLDATGRLGSMSLGVARQVAIPLLLVPPAVWSSYAKAV